MVTTQSLNRDADNQRTDNTPPLDAILLAQVLDPHNLEQAWKRMRANKGAPGIDGLTIDDFPAYFREHGNAILEAIRMEQYQPYPVKRVYIDKEDGGLRALGIPTVLDRLIQQAIVQVISPIFEPTFSEFSYGFRPSRSQHQAVRKVQEFIAEGRKIAVDVDLSKFFDRVNHDFLMTQLGRRIKDKALLRLIGRYLRAGIVEDGVLLESRIGVPQGGPLSPLLSNVVLDLLDKELEQRGHRFARYADDFIILVKSKRAGERTLISITRFAEQRLKLVVNDQKSQVVPVSKSKFLGFTFYGKQLRWHPKSLAKFKRQVRFLTGRSRGLSMHERIKELSIYLRGWINYFGIAQGFQRCIELDHWIRRRLRMCFWKQWRRPRTKVRNLLKLGISLDEAIPVAMSSKGYWRNSRSETINRAISIEYLEKLGLFSLKTRWTELHYQS